MVAVAIDVSKKIRPILARFHQPEAVMLTDEKLSDLSVVYSLLSCVGERRFICTKLFSGKL